MESFQEGMDFKKWRKDNVPSKHDNYEMIWINVEQEKVRGNGGDWGLFTGKENCKWVKQAAAEIFKRGRTPGIVTSAEDWKKTMGSETACEDLASLPLWYKKFDGKNKATPFKPIGGWKHAALKQYVDT